MTLTTMQANEVLDWLPSSVAELVDVVGLDAALTLVHKHGGTPVWVPQKARPEHWLAEEIGMDAFAKLCGYYASCRLDMPRCSALWRAVRNKTIAGEFDGGLSNSQLARKFGTTERHVRRIRQMAISQPLSGTMDLFDEFLTTGETR